MSERHIVYAVVKTYTHTFKYRVSEPLSWNGAQERWDELDDPRWHGEDVRVCGVPAIGFSVRSADDPNWPRSGTLCHVLQANNNGYTIL
jgi:hypothetical protein